MYLSKIDLDLNKSRVRRDLGNCHELHRSIMSGFPKLPNTPISGNSEHNERRKEWQILYRLEGSTILVQSGIKPDWSQLPSGYHPAGEVRELDFHQIHAGERLKFRLVANPVRQRTYERQDENGSIILKCDGSGKPRQKTKRCLITKKSDQIQWLIDRFKGAKLEECYVAAPGKIKREHQLSIIRTVQFDGVLQVVKPADFLSVLSQGIGRGKSYGCGLLSLARLK